MNLVSITWTALKVALHTSEYKNAFYSSQVG